MFKYKNYFLLSICVCLASNVWATPTPVATSNTPCEAQTLTLFADPIAGATFAWTGPNGFTSTQQNPSISNVTLAASGMYSVIATVAGVPSLPGSVNVTVNPTPNTPVASSNSPICAGGTLNLTSGGVPGATFNWTGPNGFNSVGQNLNFTNINSSSTGIYAVRATINGCPSAPVSFNVVINPIPNAPIISSNSPICESNSLNLTSNSIAGGVYSWTGPNAFISSNEDPVITNVTVSMAGTYNANVTVNGCPSSTTSLNVIVNPKPTDPIPSGNNACVGGAINFMAEPVQTPGATYTWTGPNGYISSGYSTAIASASMANNGTFRVTKTENNCSTVGDVVIAITALPVIQNVVSNSPVCIGGNLTFSCDENAVTFNWTGPNGYSSTSSSNNIPNFTAAMAGVYTASGEINGCPNNPAITVTIDAIDLPNTSITPSDTSFCNGEKAKLSAGSGFLTYLWSTGESSESINVLSQGSYTVTVSNKCGLSTANAKVDTVYALPKINLGNDIILCFGKDTMLNAGAGFSKYIWNDLSTAQTKLVKEVGKYDVNVTDKNGCKASDMIEIVKVREEIKDFFVIDSTLCNDLKEEIILDVSKFKSHVWHDGTSLSRYVVTKEGTYSVNVVDTNGCKGFDEKVVTLDCPPAVYVPNSFTPNGDDLNPLFKAYGANITNFEMKIFNRWGELLITLNDIDEGWDGERCPADVYIYRLHYEGTNRGEVSENIYGTFQLMR